MEALRRALGTVWVLERGAHPYPTGLFWGSLFLQCRPLLKEGYTLLAAHPTHLNCPAPASRTLEKPSPDHTPGQWGSSGGGTPCQALGKLQLQAYSKEEVLPLHPAVLTVPICVCPSLLASLSAVHPLPAHKSSLAKIGAFALAPPPD